jgi:protein-L-isoaspartate(D-aspartate) O-methyltransferase
VSAEQHKKIRFLMELRRAGIHQMPLLKALEDTPRSLFVPPAFADQAYENIALPIACGQTTSQPVLVAEIVQYLNVEKRHKVLEIGTGSGYQTALLARLCRRVYSIDRFWEMLPHAEAAWGALRLSNITAITGDGLVDWAGQAPFHRIVVAAALPDVPLDLAGQLAENGILIAPVGRAGQEQYLVRWTRVPGGWTEEVLRPVRFVGCFSPRFPSTEDTINREVLSA